MLRGLYVVALLSTSLLLAALVGFGIAILIAAYAQMERTLARHGLRRSPAEAPLEYLARVLRRLEVREGAVRTLTALFEYAKFSPHEIDAAMKDDAIGALVAMREDLERREELAA